jgi:hypothetical protein
MRERLGQAASFRKVCEKPLHRRYPYITQMLGGFDGGLDELVVRNPRVVHGSVEGSVHACSNCLCGEAIERITGSHLVAFRGELGVEARRTRGAVENFAQEVTWCQSKHPDVFVL